MSLGRYHGQPDATDYRIIAALQADARLSLSNLGRRVGLSAPAVMERVRKLEQAGVVTGYHALVDARRAGFDVAAFIGVSTARPEALENFEDWVESALGVQECHHVTGAYALLLKVKARDTRELEALIDTIQSCEFVQQTETMVVLSTATERVHLPLDADAPASQPAARRGRRVAASEPAAQQPAVEE